jgi:hypothetical protein
MDPRETIRLLDDFEPSALRTNLSRNSIISGLPADGRQSMTTADIVPSTLRLLTTATMSVFSAAC